MSSEVRPLMLHRFPNAILHFDADAFFTSVEQAIHPSLKGRPVVTGQERNIISCASYEAKALGIKRGVALWEARRMCKNLVVLPSDYETYSIYSKRIFNILRRYTPLVEEHSVDEGFADISGLRRLHHCSYQDIAARIQETVLEELDISISLGLSLTKTIAKVASDERKPYGITPVPGDRLHLFLARTALPKITGFGPNTVNLLNKYSVFTAYDYINRPETWAKKLLGKIGGELWHELRGNSVYHVSTEEKTSFLSISKCKTFTSPSSDRDFVYAKFVRVLESAFIKLRRYRLRARVLSVFIRTKDFREDALQVKLNRHTSSTKEVIPVLAILFDRLYKPDVEYRMSMVVLDDLEEDSADQLDLFADQLKIDRLRRLSETIDQINKRYGKHTVCLGTSLHLDNHPKTKRDEQPWRKTHLVKGENARRRMSMPRWAMDV